MENTNPLNVYRGPNSVKDYFDPESSPPLPLVEIPECLNPYRQDGVRIYAKMMTMHPANNVKSMPALNLLEKSVIPGETKTIVEYSSGSTVLSMSLIARALYGLDDVRAFLSNKTSMSKLRLMQFFGISIDLRTLFGGPSQPEPTDERGGIRAAQRVAQESESVVNPNQYENDQVSSETLLVLDIELRVSSELEIAWTMTGLGTYFKDTKPSVFRLGVCTAAGDRVPGPRSYALLAPVEFPWKSAVDHIEDVGSHESFSLSLDLCRQGIVCGPSSGFNLRGLFQFIETRKADESLSELSGPDGEIHCVFLCCDLPYQYISEYFDKLEEGHFPSIKNEELLDVDLHRYDEKWEKEALDAFRAFFEVEKQMMDGVVRFISNLGATKNSGLEDLIRPKADTAIIDLRQPDDFEHFHLPGSFNLTFVRQTTSSPFSDPAILKSLWQRLEVSFKAPSQELQSLIQDKRILLLCYDGDSSRVATSILRAKGYEADSIRGGFKALSELARAPSPVTSDEGEQDDKPWLRISNQVRGVSPSPKGSIAVSPQVLDLQSS
ncbi:Fc.00g043640.m01.CDS01 [Cosmosporella sp. VM-42]